MATVEETGDDRRTVSERPPDPYWTTRHGWVIETDERTPQGEALAFSELGQAAEAARVRIEQALRRLADFSALWDGPPAE